MPKAKRPAAESGPQKTDSRKTAKVIVQRAPRKTLPIPSLRSTATTPKSLPSCSWDSHQDDIVVNSVETAATTKLTGLEHYNHQIHLRGYEPVYTDLDTYHHSRSTKPGLPDDDDVEQNVIEAEQHTDGRETNYSEAPKPPLSFADYEYQIYTSQRNLPFINFQSALNHLPNLPPTSQLPRLRRGVLAEYISHEGRRGIDDLVIALFLPSFYDDGRHALGYYVSPTSAGSYTHRPEIRMQDAKQMLFTPCTQQDLEMYGLITYSNCRTLGYLEESDEPDDEQYIQSVGVKGGSWLGSDRVEDWQEWTQAFTIVRQVWEERLRITGLEDLVW